MSGFRNLTFPGFALDFTGLVGYQHSNSTDEMNRAILSKALRRATRRCSRCSSLLEAVMGNLSGKAYAINTISPMRWYTRPLLRLVFLLAPYLKPTRQLKKLSFIHFARWAIIPRRGWPYLGPPQERDRMKSDYLLFCSNFNGTWDQYIAAFSDILPAGINRIWGWTLNFPGAQPLAPFERFIRTNQRDTDYYYTAYPGANTTDVRKALFVTREIEKLADSTRGMPPREFARRYQAFLTAVQNSLGGTGPGPRVC